VKPRSLRARLVATMLLLLAVASAVIALVTTLTLQQFLIGRLDGDLRATSGLFQRAPLGAGRSRHPRAAPAGLAVRAARRRPGDHCGGEHPRRRRGACPRE
jgi:hypothetical protein